MDPAAVAADNRGAGPARALQALSHMVAQVADATKDPRLEQAAALIADAASRPEGGSGKGIEAIGGSAQAGPGNMAAGMGQLQSAAAQPPAFVSQGNRPIDRPLATRGRGGF